MIKKIPCRLKKKKKHNQAKQVAICRWGISPSTVINAIIRLNRQYQICVYIFLNMQHARLNNR